MKQKQKGLDRADRKAITREKKLADHKEHMARVSAVQRRSAYERALYKLLELEQLEISVGRGESERQQLVYVREMFQTIRAEMIEYGQLEEVEESQ